MEVHKGIQNRSINNKSIQYSGADIYEVRTDKLDAIISSVPEENCLDIAAYYLCSMIALQPFPDANHRTALMAVELFLNKNGYAIEYSGDDAVDFQKKFYKARFKVFNTYEERPTSILKDMNKTLLDICKEFLERHLIKGG